MSFRETESQHKELLDKLYEEGMLFAPIRTTDSAPDLEPIWGNWLFKKTVIEEVGEPGISKCLDEDTLLITEDGSLIPIKEYIKGTKILTLRDYKIEVDSPLDYLDMGYKDCLEIVTNIGRKIVVTPEHPFLKVNGWSRADSLQIGDRIAIPRVLPIEGKCPMPEYEVKLLAYFITEGTLQRTPGFTNTDDAILNDFFNCVSHFPNVKTTLQQQRKKVRTYRVVNIKSNGIGSLGRGKLNDVARFLEQHGLLGKKSRDKFIPDCIYQLPNSQLAIFLNRMFATDGWCTSGKLKHIAYCSTSEKLVRGIQHLLLRFGIVAKLDERMQKVNDLPYTSYKVIIMESTALLTFITKIGIFEQESKLEQIKENIKNCRANPNLDTVPLLRKRINGECVKSSISRARLARFEPTNPLISNDIYWDRVVLISNAGLRHVYDISMPTRNFVAADIIVHNTTFNYTLIDSLIHKRPFLDIDGCKEIKGIRVLYLDLESSDSLIKSRRAMLDLEDSDQFLKCNLPNVVLPELEHYIDRFIKDTGPLHIIFVDPLRMAFNTRDENDNAEASKQMKILRYWCEKFNCSVVIVHHSSKADMSGTRKGSGAYARTSLADIVWNFEQLGEGYSRDLFKFYIPKNRCVDDDLVMCIRKDAGSFKRVDFPMGYQFFGNNGTQVYNLQKRIQYLMEDSTKRSPNQMIKELGIDSKSDATFYRAMGALLQLNIIKKVARAEYVIAKGKGRAECLKSLNAETETSEADCLS